MKFPGFRITPGKTIAFIIACLVILDFTEHRWYHKYDIICWDIKFYYSYVPAAFVYHDMKMDFLKDPKNTDVEFFWLNKTADGKFISKTTMGLAILYTPFYFCGDLAARLTGYRPSGFTVPFRMALVLGTLFYLAIGLIFLKKILERYFPPQAVVVTLLLVAGGTNLLHYSVFDALMPHVYNFTLVTIFIWLTIKWYEKPGYWNSLLLGLLSGLITLIRPSNVTLVIIFLLWDIVSIRDFTARIRFLAGKYYLILVMVAAAVVVWIPQLLYWKYITGSWFYFSYNEERFFFNHPRILKGLFSYRKGWLLYTPVMIFALAGIPRLFKTHRKIFLPVTFFICLNIYVVYSWWTWWYGGSLGSRPMIDYYGVLAIPLAATIVWIIRQKIILRIVIILLLLATASINILYTYQYQHYCIHYDSMSKAAYWKSFGKFSTPAGFEESLEHPDYDKAIKGIDAILPKTQENKK